MNKKKSALERENKDVTCAVRLPQSMHHRLCELAEQTGSSLSDIIREALFKKMDELEEELMEKALKRARYESEMARLGSGGK